MTDHRVAAAPVRHQRPSPDAAFHYGVAYYPEHWTAAEREQDAVRMRDAGITVVRMGEFAWDVWEPAPGRYAFALFDEVIATLARHGIRTFLGTPTAAPPRWLTQQHPDMLRQTADGQRTGHGGRQHVNPLHPIFRAASRDLVQALADHYAPNPHVIGWQIDNEFHCVGITDYSDLTAAAYQAWLRRHYRDIAHLNAAWGTHFNASWYDDFADIPLPERDRPDHYPPHPGQLLEFHRFVSDVTCERQHEQVEILRTAQPAWRLFHNGCLRHLNYWQLSGELDWLGIDLYPAFGGEGIAARDWTAMKLETARAHSGSFLVPELASGPGGSRARRLPTPAPGQMRMWTWQCIAHGADGILHFRWRTCRAGAEIHWHGVLDHDDVPRRRYTELQQTAREIQPIAPLLAGTVAVVSIGVLIDAVSDDAHEAVTQQLPAPRHQAETLLSALLARHLPAGLVHAQDAWTDLEVLFLPSFPHIDADLADRLAHFVGRGGTLLATAGTGCCTASNAALDRSPPSPLQHLFGARLEEQGLTTANEVEIELDDGARLAAPHGYEWFSLSADTATVLGTWRRSPQLPTDHLSPAATGHPALTEMPRGQGRALLLGTWLTPQSAPVLIDWLATRLQWTPLVQAPAEVTARQRANSERTLSFLINHSPRPARVDCGPSGHDPWTHQPLTWPLTLPPFGMQLIEH